MSTELACPWCGSPHIIRTIPEKDPFNVMLVCQQCQRVISGNDHPSTQKSRSATRAIEEKTIQLAMGAGKLPAVRYYLTEMNKQPGANLGLLEAKEAVESLIAARGLSSAVKKPNKNGCVIVLIILVLIIASIVYFYTHR
ncbi:hypothetical protein ACTJJ0_12555 [Chitinophaga sp. 22321]|uniref:MJ0042 family finger-like domain-containing protein n=1 Tax=Chitinophaga hostae TaxID=2831022 RepID=A0ABS5IWQ5_9BACT|nr:hypothetical protein [Chitinophaga hostae]MBS0027361.1 hypothetical protein [Chitinophaga hostae]